MIGLDTSSVIDFFKGDDSLKELLESVNEPIVVNQIIYLEAMFGLDSDNKKHNNEELFYDDLFNSLINFELDSSASKKSANIFWELRKRGKIIEAFDCAIAGIYLVNGVDKIITRNVKHFEKIKGLKVMSY